MTLEEKIQAIMEGKDLEVTPASATSNVVENPASTFDQNQVDLEQPKQDVEDPTKGQSDEDEAEEEPVVTLDNPIGVDNSVDDLDDEDDKQIQEELMTMAESFVARDGKVSAEAVIKLAKEMFPNEKKLNQEHLQAAKDHILKNVSEGCKETEEEKKVEESAEELLASDANLTEEYKAKAKELFEAEVLARVESAKQLIESQYAEKLAKILEEVDAEKKEFISTISEHIDSHLEQVSEKWVVENKVEIETNIQVENAQSLMNGLKSLFEQHNLILPEGGKDVLQELQAQVNALQEQLQEQSAELTESKIKLADFERNEILNEVSKGLTELDQSRLKALVEDVEFVDAAAFKDKVTNLRESVFSRQQKQEITESFIGDAQVKTRSPVMQAYLDALTGKRK